MSDDQGIELDDLAVVVEKIDGELSRNMRWYGREGRLIESSSERHGFCIDVCNVSLRYVVRIYSAGQL